MNAMYNKINTVTELIEMLTILKDQINANYSPKHKTTVITDVYPESAEFVLSQTIEYLQSIKEDN